MRSGARLWHRLPRRDVVGLLVAVLLVGSFAGGYAIGNDSADLRAVETTASEAGRAAGLRKGAKEGYTQGLGEARGRSYRPAYAAAYRDAYLREFELAGLDPPEQIPIPGPQ